jgi:hypothetical protein
MADDRGGSSSGGKTSLQSGLEKVSAMIAWGSKLGYKQAAKNLEHWRDGSGASLEISSSVFDHEGFLLRHLAGNHRPKFIAGAERRLKSSTLVVGGATEMDWTDSVNAPLNSDLWFALGGFTVHSHVKVQVNTHAGGKLVLQFLRWETDISDVYDWDAGKSTAIPGIGRVTDDEMRALEKAGYGKAFNITSQKAAINDPSVVGDAALH